MPSVARAKFAVFGCYGCTVHVTYVFLVGIVGLVGAQHVWSRFDPALNPCHERARYPAMCAAGMQCFNTGPRMYECTQLICNSQNSPMSTAEAFWSFNGDTLDTSGNNRHITPGGTALFSPHGARLALQLQLSTNSWNPANRNDATVSFWIKIPSQTGNPSCAIFAQDAGGWNTVDTIIAIGKGNICGNINFDDPADGAGKVVLERHGPGSPNFQCLRSAVPVDDDQWHHVAVTVGPGTSTPPDAKIFIDGQMSSTAGWSTNGILGSTGTGGIEVGGLQGDPGCSVFPILVSNLGIWFRELSSPELQQLYACR